MILLTAGPIFWRIVILIALGATGKTMEKMRRRKLEIDLQKKIDRDWVVDGWGEEVARFVSRQRDWG